MKRVTIPLLLIIILGLIGVIVWREYSREEAITREPTKPVEVPQVAPSPAEQLVVQARQQADAFLRGDYEALVDFMPPDLIRTVGGRDKLIASVRVAMEEMHSQGHRIDRISLGTPSEIVKEGADDVAIVPTETVMLLGAEAKEATINSYLVGISRTGGRKWFFIDGNRLSRADLSSMYPTLVASVEIPERRNSLVEETRGILQRIEAREGKSLLKVLNERKSVESATHTPSSSPQRDAQQKGTKAVTNDQLDALHELGRRYYAGVGGADRDVKEAMRYFMEAAVRGHAASQGVLAVAYENGEGVRKDIKEAAKWYRAAAAQGDRDAQFRIGVFYHSGAGVREDLGEAVRWYRLAADQGHPIGQYALGSCLAQGDGVEKDIQAAVHWFQESANQGYMDAQVRLGQCYEDGEGVSKNERAAITWFHRAAEQGSTKAMVLIGFMHNSGRGVPQDKVQALRWFRKAAEFGDVLCQNLLGSYYEQGEVVSKDLVAAAKWYRKAAEKGNKSAREALKRLNGR